MKIISWNINGIRAIERKGELQNLINNEDPDVLFLQEIKANKEQLSEYLTQNTDYMQSYHSAEKKGYSGVGVWLKKKFFKEPIITTGMPNWSDTEGRIIQYSYNNIYMLGIYFPNGGKSEDAWKEKLVFYDHFLAHINQLRQEGWKIIFCGDLNVAHQEIDLARPKANEKNVGFRPEERKKIDALIHHNWVDVFRYKYPSEISYTWWDMPSRARERNVGWRIDYFFVDKTLIKNLRKIEHLNQQMGSDHCPVVLDMILE